LRPVPAGRVELVGIVLLVAPDMERAGNGTASGADPQDVAVNVHDAMGSGFGHEDVLELHGVHDTVQELRPPLALIDVAASGPCIEVC
jgi:hypothetical protein